VPLPELAEAAEAKIQNHYVFFAPLRLLREIRVPSVIHLAAAENRDIPCEREIPYRNSTIVIIKEVPG
jgi:hypothetical protein